MFSLTHTPRMLALPNFFASLGSRPPLPPPSPLLLPPLGLVPLPFSFWISLGHDALFMSPPAWPFFPVVTDDKGHSQAAPAAFTTTTTTCQIRTSRWQASTLGTSGGNHINRFASEVVTIVRQAMPSSEGAPNFGFLNLSEYRVRQLPPRGIKEWGGCEEPSVSPSRSVSFGQLPAPDHSGGNIVMVNCTVGPQMENLNRTPVTSCTDTKDMFQLGAPFPFLNFCCTQSNEVLTPPCHP